MKTGLLCHHRNTFKIYSNRKQLLFHNIIILLYFDQIHAALVSLRDFNDKNIKNPYYVLVGVDINWNETMSPE